MKLFALKDKADREGATLAVLTCYEAERVYYLDMPEGTDPWTVPFVLSSFAARGQWTIGPEWAGKWVESRLVPQSRQNLGEVLKVNGLDSYDTLRLLEMTEGRNSQDDCYLERLRFDDAPAWFRERELTRVVEAVALDGFRLLVAFRTGEVRLYDAGELVSIDCALERVVSDQLAFSKAEPALGGRGVRWGTSISVGDEQLVGVGQLIPLTWEDFACIAPALLLDASETAQELGCTRQNVNALVKRGSLRPVKSSDKATLFLHADVLARRSGCFADGSAIRYSHVYMG